MAKAHPTVTAAKGYASGRTQVRGDENSHWAKWDTGSVGSRSELRP